MSCILINAFLTKYQTHDYIGLEIVSIKNAILLFVSDIEKSPDPTNLVFNFAIFLKQKNCTSLKSKLN